MNELIRQVGLFSATTLVVANMVGTGIFTTSGFIMAELGSPQAVLLCWLVGGLFALCGALCYGELGAMFPRAGGEYVFLKESFGGPLGFLSGWISLIVGFSAPIAASAIAFSSYLFRTFSLPSGPEMDLVIFGFNAASFSPRSGTAVGVIILFSLVHYQSLLTGTRIQNVLTLFKVLFILVFVSAGLFRGNGSFSHFGAPFDVHTLIREDFAISLIFVSFAYSGWNAAAYLGSEITRPHRNIPLALVAGTLMVIGLYLFLNLLYVYALPPGEMAGVLEVGAKSAAFLFGEQAGRYFSGAIALGLLSVLSAMILAGPRVYFAMARDGLFFERFARVHPDRHTPATAIFLQAGIAVFMVITASFDELLLYIGFVLALFAMVTVVGLVRLRLTRPHATRPYHTLGYPLTPVLFIAANLWIITYSIKSRPMVALAGSFTLFLGICAYVYFKRGTRGITDSVAWKEETRDGQ